MLLLLWLLVCSYQRTNSKYFFFFNEFHSDVFPYGIYMLTYEYMNRFLDDINWIKAKRKEYKSHACNGCPDHRCLVEMYISITSGAIAGIMSWILVIPFDVMKTIIQAQSNPDKQRNMRNLLITKKNVRIDRFE